ncbi:hypothetical protein GPA27_12465 [Aromatoleum toluolicum]|uniref:Helix-turn-helix domain-containing protein n=1 Tax=Aromatoleum toluolicum TaxID=90060 RepID=A0ABX1NFZ7_9RHOO|nr:hypothetical protein [Aromatoleum toluolicum]NMF98199.1 hypothetical protein [Aromatoleum toluolicum]
MPPIHQRTDRGSILRAHTTEQAATLLQVKPQTLRAALCRGGNYLGITPVKRANRFLAWPADQVEAVARGEVA